MSFKVTVGEKVYYDDDWCSEIHWEISYQYNEIKFGSAINNSECGQENIEKYVKMIAAIENNTREFIHIGSYSPSGDPYGALVKSADGNFTIDFGDCDLRINIGKLLNDKAIFEDIVNKLQ